MAGTHDNSPAVEQLHQDLRQLEWAKGLSEDTLTEITRSAEWVAFSTGQVVIQVDSQATHVYFLITGRMEATLYNLLGKEIQKDTFVRGSVIGLFSLGLSDLSHLAVQAAEPSTAIRLTLPALLQLTAAHADFQLAMFRLGSNVVKQRLMVDRSLPKPAVVGIIHHTEASRPLVARLAHRLRDLGESPCIAGDNEHWKPEGDIPFKLLAGDGQVQERYNILKDWTSTGRLLVDFSVQHSADAMMRVVSYADTVLWCIRPQDAPSAVQILQDMEKNAPKWREKIRIVWILDNNAPLAPYVPELYELAERDFKLTFDAPGAHQGSLLQHGFERIVHHLRGVQIGLALGGGAARGMAHLGVLKALEQHGVYIDMLAGTSAGALTGGMYAAGLDPEYIIHCFKTDLQPPWFFRQLPAGGYWYLLYKYRRNQFASMLRKYVGRAKLKQLILPVFTVGVDLVEGKSVIREGGEAAIAILESINLPPLSLPIIQSDQAMVDGGLLNNIPANVLVAKGCNFVLASSVTAKLEKDFAGIRSRGRSRGSRFLSTIQVIMRQSMIQNYSMNSVGIEPADFVIAPDVTSFDISEFTRADEMALIGETTTNATVAQLSKMLNKLDPMLFGSSLNRAA